MTHILIAESLHQSTLELLSAEHQATLIHDGFTTQKDGITLHYQPDITVEAIEATLHHYDGIITRPKPISAKAINPTEHLKIIIRGGTGVNSIALNEATQKGIIVENTPGQNSISTAEYTFGLMYELAARRQIFLAHIDVMESSERELLALEPSPYTGHELAEKTLAIIGLGAIGQALAKRAKAFEMNVISYSASFQDNTTDPRIETLGIRQASSLYDAIAEADIICLHTPLNEITEHMVNDEFFKYMKQGALLINTARPQLVSPAALEKAVAEHRLAGYGVDGDPDLILPFVDIAKRHPHTPILCTHHIADATEEAQIKITRQCMHQLFMYLSDGNILNQVN